MNKNGEPRPNGAAHDLFTRPGEAPPAVADRYRQDAQATIYCGDRLDFLATLPAGSATLIVTSPPYNIGKKYERRTELAR